MKKRLEKFKSKTASLETEVSILKDLNEEAAQEVQE
jgi:hypothetical protein